MNGRTECNPSFPRLPRPSAPLASAVSHSGPSAPQEGNSGALRSPLAPRGPYIPMLFPPLLVAILASVSPPGGWLCLSPFQTLKCPPRSPPGSTTREGPAGVTALRCLSPQRPSLSTASSTGPSFPGRKAPSGGNTVGLSGTPEEARIGRTPKVKGGRPGAVWGQRPVHVSPGGRGQEAHWGGRGRGQRPLTSQE